MIKMLREMNRDRYKALQLLADHLHTPSKDLSLDAIFNDVKDEDLKWVTEKIHYYTSGALKFLIPLSLVSIAVYLSKRVKNNRKDIILDRDL